ncbi:MAG TPA: PEP-CTERM sorting domain-containing protein [Verrucomicrobiae bacterium]|nr:PEP-CTERM sorting domain-containing protein [Verrucomicrobiae bacterium]
MKLRPLLLPAVCLSLLILPAVSAYSQTVVTFDNLRETGTGAFLPNGYQGLVWSNFWCFNAILATNRPDTGVSGYYFGMVSQSNDVNNAFGIPAEIDSVTNFNFLSVYLTGAWSSNLNIEVEGFNGAQEIYDRIVVASATNPTLFTFNYLDIDRLYFDAYGGQDAGFPVDHGEGSPWFVMDNFAFDFVPEPSSLLLTILGAAMLWVALKHRRT